MSPTNYGKITLVLDRFGNLYMLVLKMEEFFLCLVMKTWRPRQTIFFDYRRSFIRFMDPTFFIIVSVRLVTLKFYDCLIHFWIWLINDRNDTTLWFCDKKWTKYMLFIFWILIQPILLETFCLRNQTILTNNILPLSKKA